jgi:hypothetical protein
MEKTGREVERRKGEVVDVVVSEEDNGKSRTDGESRQRKEKEQVHGCKKKKNRERGEKKEFYKERNKRG